MDVFELLQTLLQVELTTRRTNLVQARSLPRYWSAPYACPMLCYTKPIGKNGHIIKKASHCIATTFFHSDRQKEKTNEPHSGTRYSIREQS